MEIVKNHQSLDTGCLSKIHLSGLNRRVDSKSDKVFKGGSVIWKAVVSSFPVIRENLVWDIGDGRKLRIGEDP